jgi:hypothetical protein
MFARAVMQALYTFRLLDDLYYERLRILPDQLILSYLAYRVAHEPTNGNPLLRCMRRVVDVIEETESNDDREPATIETRIRNTLVSVNLRRLKDIMHWKSEVSEAEYERYLFAAGIRVNSFAIVRQSLTKNTQLISELKDLQSDNLIYGPYYRLVAIYGGQEILGYLMTHGTSTVNKGLRLAFFQSAARSSRAETVRYVYHFKKDEEPWNFTDNHALYSAADTASLEVLKFIAELRGLYPSASISKERAEYSLSMCVEMGWLDTVKYAIQLGAHPRGLTDSIMGNPRDNSPMRRACMRGHTAVVEYLLAHGASPEQTIAMASNWGRIELVQRLLEIGIPPTGALSKASAGGYLDLVRLLLDAGVDPNETMGPKSPLVNAIAKEHTAMFTLLVERGADLHADGVAEECVQRARKDGLDSMLLLLQAHGVDIARETSKEDRPQGEVGHVIEY